MKERPMCILAIGVILMILLTTIQGVLANDVLNSKEKRIPDKSHGSFCGQVIKKQKTKDKINLVLKEQRNINILVYIQEDSCQIGDKVKIQGTIYRLQNKRNKGMFHQALYMKSINIDYTCKGETIEVMEENHYIMNDFKEDLFRLRMKCYEKLFHIFPEEMAGILGGMILGDKGGMQEETKTLYQQAGILHLISISGLHITFLGISLYHFMRKILGYLGSGLVTAGFLGSYLLLCGGSVSALRAVFMSIIMITGWYLGRTYDLLSAISMAAIVILLKYPYQLYQSGFLLSFGAVLGICLVSKQLTVTFVHRNEKGPGSKIKEAVLSNLGIQMTTCPVILYSYFEVPLYGLVLNLIFIPFMSLILLSGILAMVVGFVSVEAGSFLGGVAVVLLQGYELLAKFTISLPFARLKLGQPDIVCIVIYYLCLTVSVYGLHKLNQRKEKRIEGQKGVLEVKDGYDKLKAAFVFFLWIGFFVLGYHPPKELNVTMLDVGQGDAIVIERKNRVYLVDGGSSDVPQVGKYRMIPYLKSQGIVVIDGIFISHMDSDHVSGIKELVEAGVKGEFVIKRAFLPNIDNKDQVYMEMEEQLKKIGIGIVYLNRGMDFEIDNLRFKILQPKPGVSYSDRNEGSLVFEISYQDFSILFTGDVEGQGEKELLETGALQEIDVLKVAHHGSEYTTSQEMLEILRPKIGLISCGLDNKYGHPHENLLQRLDDIHSHKYITACNGAISLDYWNNKLKVKLMVP